MTPGTTAEFPDAVVVSPANVSARRRARTKIAVFLALVTVFAVIAEALLVCVPFGTRIGALTWTPSLGYPLQMWSVGLAGLITLVTVDRSWRDIGRMFAPRRYWLLAMALPVIYCAAVYVPAWVFGLAGFAGVSRLGVAVLSAGLYFPVSLLAATGEELGWRGVLVPNLARVADARVVAFLPGVIWAAWHYPNILLLGNTETPVLFALICFSLMLVGHGVFLSWLRLASGSIWPAAVFHGVHNSVIYGIFDRVTEPRAPTFYVTTEYGVGLALAGAAVGCLFWSRIRSSLRIPS